MAKYFDSERIIHGMKTALACFVGYAVMHLMQLPTDPWLIITMIVVMCAQINVGSVINKSYMRFLGTLTGSLIAALTLGILGNNPYISLCVIAFSSMIFSYIATGENKYNDAGTLGAVTVVIILMGENPTLFTAAHRFLEISVGILIAALISQFIFPAKARDHLRGMQAQTLQQIRDYYFTTLMINSSPEIIDKYHNIDEAIVKSLSKQRILAKQSARELFDKFDVKQFTKILRCEKAILRSIVCMHYAGDMLPTEQKILKNISEIKDFHEAIHTALEKISQCIEQKDFSEAIAIPSIQPTKIAFSEISGTLSTDEAVYINGFVFCAEILVVQLKELVTLLTKNSVNTQLA